MVLQRIDAVFELVLVFLVTVSTVNRPPGIFIQMQKDRYFKPNETVELPCVARGYPKPTYKWKFNFKDFNPSGQDDRVVQLPDAGTIVFNAPEDKDEGIYQCFADNGYGVSASVKCNLREAKLANFPIENDTIHIVHAGDSLMLPCTPPTSVPPADDVKWVVKEPDGRWTLLNFSKRITMDLEGGLRFVNIERGDAKGEKAYACHVINNFMGKYVPGPEHYIQVLGTPDKKYPAREFGTSPSDHFALRGSTLKLKCIFAGNPTPDVYWTKTDGIKEVDLPPNSQHEDFGMMLVINNIRIEDAGQYECIVSNTNTSQRSTKGFNVRVESAPYWIDEPKDIEASIGQKATFICRAGGIPAPRRYIWYINGVPLRDVEDTRIHNNIRFFKPNANNITITDLTLEDHMNIQCNATNRHDYVFADVFLNVLYKPLGINCTTASTGECEPNARCLPSRSEYICTCDIGYYDDNGFNSSGNCQNMDNLMVSAISFSNVETRGFTVSWTGPADLTHVSSYAVSWTLVSGQTISRDRTTPTADITGLEPGGMYTVTVTTVNGMTQVSSTRTVSANKEHSTKPGTPGPINDATSELNATDNTIKIVWAAPQGQVSNYRVQVFDGDVQKDSKSVASSMATISFGDMKNGYRYTVNITAESPSYDGGKTVDSDRYSGQIKTVVIPPTVPKNFKCGESKDIYITLVWEDPEYPNGDLLQYQIDVYLNADLNSVKKTDLTETPVNEFKIQNLEPGTYYKFRIYTLNEQFTSEDYAITACKTSDRVDTVTAYKSDNTVIIVLAVCLPLLAIGFTFLAGYIICERRALNFKSASRGYKVSLHNIQVTSDG